MINRPIVLASLLSCAFPILICCEVRGQIAAGVDTPSASTAVFTYSILGDPETTLDLESGPFDIHREEETGYTVPGDGTGFIDTEIKDLTLTENGGPFTIRIGQDNGVLGGAGFWGGVGGPTGQTLGRIENVVTNGGTLPSDFISGDSYFEVFFEVDVAGMTLYNRDPHILTAPGITNLPPLGDVHFPPTAPVDLYLRLGQINSPSDPIVGQARGDHTLAPEPSSLALLGLACVGFFGYRRRRSH